MTLARILACEAVTSLGESLAETALLWRAGVHNVAKSRFVDSRGERIAMCAATALPATLLGFQRLVALAAHALARLHTALGAAAGAPRVQLLLGLPERLAEADGELGLTPDGRALLDALRTQLPPAWQDAEIAPFPYGRASGVLALQRATSQLAGGTLMICGGVDSQHDWAVLEALQRADRLLGPDNVDGVRPGEAAAFAVLDGGRGDDAALHVVSLGVGREPHPVGAETQSTAQGLTQALRAAVEPLRRTQRRCNHWLLDHTHEAYATQALQNVITRFGDVLGLRTVLHTPLKDLGDAGAAAVPLLIGLAAQAWRLGYADDDMMVLASSSDGGARGAVLLAGWPRRESGSEPASWRARPEEWAAAA